MQNEVQLKGLETEIYVDDEIYGQDANSQREVDKRVACINKNLHGAKIFYGPYIKSISQVLAEGRAPMSISQVIQKRLETKATSEGEFWMSQTIDTGDAIAYHPDGRIKFVLDSKHLRKFASVEESVNKVGASVLAAYSNGALILSDRDYESLAGAETSEKNMGEFILRKYNSNRRKGMTPQEIKSNSLWQFLARDKSLLRDYVDYLFSNKELTSKDNGYNGLAMDIILPESKGKTPLLLPLRIEGGPTSELTGFYGLNWKDTRLFGVSSTLRQSPSYKSSKFQGDLERALASSSAGNIENALRYLSFNEDGSLHTNGNYDDDKKRVLYHDIVSEIPSDRITSVREKLEDSLPYLKAADQSNPESIRKYFKEKFGIPLESYSDVSLFYETLLEVETGKK